MGYILYREAMAPPSGSTPKMPRSCQQSHQLSVAQIAVTAKDMEADGVPRARRMPRMRSMRIHGEASDAVANLFPYQSEMPPGK